jgi:Glycosyl transferase family 2
MASKLNAPPVALVSHVNGDGDLLDAWFTYYQNLGVTRFHLIVHGAPEENAQLFAMQDRYPIVIEERYEGPFDSEQKKSRLDAVLARMPGRWVMLVDSDEFVELPYLQLPEMIRMLELEGADTVFAPMMQRLTFDGSLVDLGVGEDPFRVFPLCSPDLYLQMGVSASISKFPLFYCTGKTSLVEEGNHSSPNGWRFVSVLQGVTHHFKFRRFVLRRLDARVRSTHAWRHESVLFQQYFDAHSNRLPTTGSFAYSREVLFGKGFLRKFTRSKIAGMTAKLRWKQRRFVSCFFALTYAVILRPAVLGHLLKPLRRHPASL